MTLCCFIILQRNDGLQRWNVALCGGAVVDGGVRIVPIAVHVVPGRQEDNVTGQQ